MRISEVWGMVSASSPDVAAGHPQAQIPGQRSEEEKEVQGDTTDGTMTHVCSVHPCLTYMRSVSSVL